MNDFMLATFGAAAEFERELISERVEDGMGGQGRRIRKLEGLLSCSIKVSMYQDSWT